MRSTANPIVFTKLDLLLQRLLDSVQHGYTHVASGQVEPSKALRLASKFGINYQVEADKNLRARRKRNGLGNAKWLCYTKNDVVYWWLMVTPPQYGDHLAHASEKLVDVTKAGNALKFERFELVELPYSKPTKPKPANYKEHTKAKRRTWRLNREAYESARLRIIDDVRTGDPFRLTGLIRSLYSMPGFGEIRSQVGKLVALYSAEVKRAGLQNAPAPLDTLRYTRRLADDGIRLSVLAEAYQLKLDEVHNHV
jgi:hypothetical protein